MYCNVQNNNTHLTLYSQAKLTDAECESEPLSQPSCSGTKCYSRSEWHYKLVLHTSTFIHSLTITHSLLSLSHTHTHTRAHTHTHTHTHKHTYKCTHAFVTFCAQAIFVTGFWKISLNVTLKYIELHNLL